MLLAFSADYNAMAGNRAQALAQIKQALALSPSNGEVRIRAAIVYNRFGYTDRCLSALRTAASLGYAPEAIRDTPDFDHLRGDARFPALAELKN